MFLRLTGSILTPFSPGRRRDIASTPAIRTAHLGLSSFLSPYTHRLLLPVASLAYSIHLIASTSIAAVMATIAPMATPTRQPFGILNDSKLRHLQSVKNRQNGEHSLYLNLDLR